MVVLDVTTHEALRDATLLIQLTAQGEADVQAGRTVVSRPPRTRTRSHPSELLGKQLSGTPHGEVNAGAIS